MAGIKITGNFVTNDPADTYGLLEDKFFIGGFRAVATLTDRDNITKLRRKWGMLCYVAENDTTYILKNNNGNIADNSNWEIYATGSSSVSGDVNVDNITIEKVNISKYSTENDFISLISNNWNDISNTDINDWEYSSLNNGRLYVTKNLTVIFEYGGDTNLLNNWEGTFEFYSTVNIDSSSPTLYDENDNSYQFSNGVLEDNGLWRYSVTIPTCKIVGFYLDSGIDGYASIYLINRISPETKEEITILNINRIINEKNISIDDDSVSSTDSQTELVTKSYVDTKYKADEITLTKQDSLPIVREDSDYNYILHNGWSNDFPTSNWSLGDNTSYNNGVFTTNYQHTVLGSGTIITNSSPSSISKNLVVKLISNRNDVNYFLDDNNLGQTVQAYYTKDLGNSQYEYTAFLYKDFSLSQIVATCSIDTIIETKIVDINQTTESIEFRIKNIDYIIDDDLQSIDGSNTPASDPHRELVTRAYVQSISSGSESITYNELINALNNGTLSPGKFYTITDYTHVNYEDPSETNTYSIIHPIIVKAIQSNKISSVAIDPEFPDDIISYNPFINTTPYTTGAIIYRKDTRRLIEGDFDWRLTRYRRWGANWQDFYSLFPDDTEHICATNSTIYNFGYNSDGQLTNLIPNSDSKLIPVIDDSYENVYNIKFIKSKYITLILKYPDNSYLRNIEFNGVTKVSFYSDLSGNGVEDVRLKNIRDTYFFGYIKNFEITSGTNTFFNIIRNAASCKIKDLQRFVIISMGTIESDSLISYSWINGIFNNNKFSGGNVRLYNVSLSDNIFSANTINIISHQTSASHVSNNNVSVSTNFIINDFISFNNNHIDAIDFEYVTLGQFDNVNFRGKIRNAIFANVDGWFSSDTIYDPNQDIDNTEFDIQNGNIHVNNTDDNKVCLIASVNYLVDTTDGTFSLQLPSYATDGLELTFIDIGNNCYNNPFTIKRNNSPETGYINTINGKSEWKLDTNLGLLKIRYDSNFGWIVVQETIVQSGVDDITIEENSGHFETNYTQTTGSNVGNWITNTLIPISDENEWNVNTGTFVDNNRFDSDESGPYVVHLLRSTNTPYFTWEQKSYYLYTTEQVSTFYFKSRGVQVGEGTNYATYNANYLGTENINGTDYHKYEINVDNSNDNYRQIREIYAEGNNPFSLLGWKQETIFIPPQHSIKNIDYIIDDNLQSIDESHTPASDPHRELVTRAYVDYNIEQENGIDTKEIFVVDNDLINNRVITLSNNPKSNKHLMVFLNGILEDENEFYTVSGNQITILNDVELIEGTKIAVLYTY